MQNWKRHLDKTVISPFTKRTAKSVFGAPKEKMQFIKIFCVIALFLFTGCATTSDLSTQVQATQTLILSTKPEDNITVTVSNITATSKPSLSIPLDVHLSIECVEIVQKDFLTSEIKSAIVFAEKASPNQVYLRTTNNPDKVLITDEKNKISSDIAASSDGKWLAYIQSDLDDNRNTVGNWLVLLSSDGKLNKKLPLDVNIFISGWLNNEQLLMSRGLGPNSAQFVLNPFTDLQQELSLSFFDLYDYLPVNNWGNIKVYDPNLTRVVYAGVPADIVLADARNKSIITRISPAPVVHSVPKWSPDGQQFVIAFADILNPMNDPENWRFELHSVSRDGQINQLTNLSAYYDHPRIPFYIWSPNGKYIAFWVETNPKQQGGVFDLAVLNLDTNSVTNYCIKSVAKGFPKLFWSPNSEQLLVETFDKNREINHLILVDIAQHWAVQIGENITPLGWMTTP